MIVAASDASSARPTEIFSPGLKAAVAIMANKHGVDLSASGGLGEGIYMGGFVSHTTTWGFAYQDLFEAVDMNMNRDARARAGCPWLQGCGAGIAGLHTLFGLHRSSGCCSENCSSGADTWCSRGLCSHSFLLSCSSRCFSDCYFSGVRGVETCSSRQAGQGTLASCLACISAAVAQIAAKRAVTRWSASDALYARIVSVAWRRFCQHALLNVRFVYRIKALAGARSFRGPDRDAPDGGNCCQPN